MSYYRCKPDSLLVLIFAAMLFSMNLWAQQAKIMGQITDDGQVVPYVNISLKNNKKGTSSNEDGQYKLGDIKPGRYVVLVSALGYRNYQTRVTLFVK